MSSTTSIQKYQKNLSHKCQVCFEQFDENDTNLCKMEKVKCQNCQASAHKFCYAPTSKSKLMLCDKCKYQSESQSHIQKQNFKCCICLEQIGLLKLVKSSDPQKKYQKFAHVICLLFSSSFFVESYENLKFLQMSPFPQNSCIRRCKSCKKPAGTNDSWKCSQQKCQERIHFKCFFQYKEQIDQNLEWKHNFGRVKATRIDWNHYFRNFHRYIQKYFQEDQQDEIVTKVASRSFLISESCNLYCGRHSKKSKSSCLCQKQYPSSFIFCESCSSWNHAKCQKIYSSSTPLRFKCLQCKDWQGIIKKRKKPILPNYPNMKIYDYIYIQVCFQKNSYKLTQKQQQILLKLPIVPSVQYYPIFAQNYLSKHLHSEICIQNIRKWMSKDNSEQTPQLVKSVKLIKIIISSYQNLEKLRDQFANKKEKEIKCDDVKKLLKEYNKKFLKFNKISILIDNPVKKQYIQPQQTKKAEFVQPQPVKQPQIEQVPIIRLSENKCNDQAIKNQNWQVEIGGTILILDEQHHSKSKSVKQSNVYANKLKREAEIRIEEKKYLLDQQMVMMDEVLQGMRSRVNKSSQLLILRRQIQIMKREQKKEKEKIKPSQTEYLTFKLGISSLEMDLNNRAYEITNKYRYKLLEYLQKIDESKRGQYISIMSEQLMISNKEISWKQLKMEQMGRIIEIHKNLLQLITDLNTADDDSRNKIEYVSQLKNSKLSVNNLCIFFNFFYKCRNLHIVNHNILLQNLQQIANKMILTNSKQIIKKAQQLLAYEVIVNNFPLEAPWIREELRKKYAVQAMICNYVISTKSQILNRDCNWLLIGELFKKALSYCEQNKMQYYCPKIEMQLEWYKIQRKCIENIPLYYLFPELEQIARKKIKISSSQIKQIHKLMIQKVYPENRIKKTVAYYHQKLLMLTKNIEEFLTILDKNIKNKQVSSVKYEKEEVVKWIYLLKTSQFQCPQLISEIEDILYVYESLCTRMQELSFQIIQIEQGEIEQNKTDLKKHLDKIPIKFNYLLTQDKSIIIQSMKELRPKNQQKFTLISLI